MKMTMYLQKCVCVGGGWKVEWACGQSVCVECVKGEPVECLDGVKWRIYQILSLWEAADRFLSLILTFVDTPRFILVSF